MKIRVIFLLIMFCISLSGCADHPHGVKSFESKPLIRKKIHVHPKNHGALVQNVDFENSEKFGERSIVWKNIKRAQLFLQDKKNTKQKNDEIVGSYDSGQNNEWRLEAGQTLSRGIVEWQKRAKFADVYLALGGFDLIIQKPLVVKAKDFCEAFLQLQNLLNGSEHQVDVGCRPIDGVALIVLDQDEAIHPDRSREVHVIAQGCAFYDPDEKSVSVQRPAQCAGAEMPNLTMFTHKPINLVATADDLKRLDLVAKNTHIVEQPGQPIAPIPVALNSKLPAVVYRLAPGPISEFDSKSK